MEDNNIEQQNNQEMTPEEAKASLGIATYLQSQMLPQEQMEGEETQETAPEPEQIDPEAMKEDVMKEVRKMIKDEIGGIKEMIKEALKEDGDKE